MAGTTEGAKKAAETRSHDERADTGGKGGDSSTTNTNKEK